MNLDDRKPAGTGLLDLSIDLLRDHQEPTGAWLASPTFPTYRYCWLRDSVLIGHALDRVGAHDHTTAFYRWSADTILAHAHKIDRLHDARPDHAPDEPLPSELALHPRFTTEGAEVDGQWGNVQLDGYGLWLTGLTHHLRTTGAPVAPYRPAVETVMRYLNLAWDLPCYDTWEEYPYRRHPTTLAAIARGLSAAGHILDDARNVRLADDIVSLIHDRGTHRGALTKFLTDDHTATPTNPAPHPPGSEAVAGHERPGRPLPPDTVDASALLVLDDFGPFDQHPDLVARTLRRITTDLVANEGGVHRYLEDEYYGGGLWIVLAGALAHIHRHQDDRLAWKRTIRWIETQADTNGHLAEQVPHTLRHPELHQPWTQRWGPIATPLLWSHAMYVIATTDQPRRRPDNLRQFR